MKSGMVSLVGRTNVGKSTLMNRLLEEKVSIVSPVAQTTRNVVRGILNNELGQAALLDTPGVHRTENDLGRIMNRAARQSVSGVDVVLLIVDGSERPEQEDEGWMRKLIREPAASLIAINKADLTPFRRSDYEKLWQRVVAASVAEDSAEVAPPENKSVSWLEISASTGAGLATLTAAIFERLPEGPPLFPEDLLTDYPRKLSIADTIREKMMVLVHDEIPHALAVQVERLDDSADTWEIEATIMVNRYSQKGIVIGHKGRLIRKARRQAEAELAAIYEHPVRLNLRVKVQENWMKNHWILKQLGYVP